MPTMDPYPDGDEQQYVVQVVARRTGVHPRTIQVYERLGLLQRGSTPAPLYTEGDIARVRLIRRLVDDLGVNLAGADVILHMREQLLTLHRELERLRQQRNPGTG